MTDCIALTDRMPTVAHGRESWTREEEAHLEACASCAAEWRLVGGALLLGAGAAQRLQPGPLAARILAGVREQGGRAGSARRWLRWAPVALAAGAALAIVARNTPQDGSQVPAVTVAAGEILPEFLDLSAVQLEALLEAVPASDAAVEIRGFNDLTDEDVSSLLSNLEG